MKDHLIFDTTDANTIIDSDSVGAFIRSDDGTLITHHTVASDEGLDVYLINSSIAVSATDLDIRDLTAVSDSVQSHLFDGAGTALTSTLVGADQALDVNVVGGVNVEVDLSHVDDSVRLGDGSSFFTSTTEGADIGLDVNIINPSIIVTATDLDIRDLSAASDSVQSNMFDGAGTALTSTLIGADQALDVNIANTLVSVNDAALANTAIASAAKTLTLAGTAETVVSSPLSDRKYLFVYNKGNRQIFLGGASVSASNGFPLSPGSYLSMRAGAASPVYFDSGASSQEIRTLELS